MKRLLSFILMGTMLFSFLIVSGAEDLSAKKQSNILLGDVDGSGQIDSLDALSVLRFTVGLEQYTQQQQLCAEVDAKEGINSLDALSILQYSVGMIYFFEAEGLYTEMSHAYEADSTADVSFHLTKEGLPQKTVFFINHNVLYPKGEQFYNAQVARLVCSLQGLLNREFDGVERTNLIYLAMDLSDTFWSEYIMGDGKFLDGYHTVTIESFEEFAATFENQLKQCGIIEWDANVPATANVAATICGLNGYLPVLKEESADSFYQTLIKEYGLSVKQSLVGQFSGKKGESIAGTSLKSTGSAKNDAYRWALEKYMDRCSSRYLAYTVDGAGCVIGNPTASLGGNGDIFSNCILNHDYLIARRCFFFDLSCYDGEAPCDDPDQPIGTDAETFKMILRRRYERAGGEFGEAFGFPPWWLKYASEFQQGSQPAVTLEWMSTDIFTSYNLAKEADAAHPCSMTNGSVYYKYTLAADNYRNTEPVSRTKYNKKVKYFTFYVGDYDSSAWLKKWVYEYWSKDKKRGEIPLMWSYNPNLSNRVPMVFDYIHENKTPNDYFAAGDSGAGYIFPSALYQGGNQYRELPSGAKAWAAYCYKYYQKFDLDITGVIINGHYPVTNEIMDLYSSFSPIGAFHSDSRRPLTIYHGTPYLTLPSGFSGKEANLNDSVKQMYATFRRNSDVSDFSGFRTVCNSPTELYNLQKRFIEYANGKDTEGYTYELADPYNFFDLVLQSGQGEKVS